MTNQRAFASLVKLSAELIACSCCAHAVTILDLIDAVERVRSLDSGWRAADQRPVIAELARRFNVAMEA